MPERPSSQQNTLDATTAPRRHSSLGMIASALAAASLLCSTLSYVQRGTEVAGDASSSFSEGLLSTNSPLWIAAIALAAVAVKLALRTLGEQNRHALFQVTGLVGALLAVFAAVYLALY